MGDGAAGPACHWDCSASARRVIGSSSPEPLLGRALEVLGNQLLIVFGVVSFSIRIQVLGVPEALYRWDLLHCSSAPPLVPPLPPLHLTQNKLHSPLVWDFLSPLFLPGIQALRLTAGFCPIAKLIRRRRIPPRSGVSGYCPSVTSASPGSASSPAPSPEEGNRASSQLTPSWKDLLQRADKKICVFQLKAQLGTLGGRG